MAPRSEPIPIVQARAISFVQQQGKRRKTVVKNISFDVYADEILTIVGESGSGKTAVAKILLGLERPTTGELLFNGRTVVDKREYWRNVQTVFQDPMTAFNQYFSIKTQLLDCFNLFDEEYLPDQKIERIRTALESVNLDPSEILDKHHFQLAPGQLERLMLARIALIRPRLLVADEPTSNIDASSRVSMLDLLLDFNASLRMSIVYFTHDLGLAQYVSDRLCILADGEIVETGSPDRVVAAPRHAYSRQLLDDTPSLKKNLF